MPDDPVQEELPHVRDDRYSVVYSNWVQGSRSPWDISLLFGHVREFEPNRAAVVDVVNVVMAPQLAKALLGTLAATVKEYEMDNGEIPVPGIIKRAAEERAKTRASASPSVSPSASASPSASPSASASPSEEAAEGET